MGGEVLRPQKEHRYLKDRHQCSDQLVISAAQNKIMSWLHQRQTLLDISETDKRRQVSEAAESRDMAVPVSSAATLRISRLR